LIPAIEEMPDEAEAGASGTEHEVAKEEESSAVGRRLSLCRASVSIVILDLQHLPSSELTVSVMSRIEW
jgi:hypothetical protein